MSAGKIVNLVLVWLVLNAIDFASTLILVGSGCGVELNPLMLKLMSWGNLYFFIYKMVLVPALIIYLVPFFTGKSHYYLWIGLVVLYGLVCANGLVQILLALRAGCL